jgi:acyl-CoA synthetase (AMP-forming)/AMP-acid ligase II
MSTIEVMPEPAPRGRNPFATGGVERGADGVAQYVGRPDSLVHLLRTSVERDAAAGAVAEVGGGSLTYGELWQRGARVAGGLRAAGVERGDRVAIRLQNGIDWVLAFFGVQLAGAVAVPVNTHFTDEEAAYVVGDAGSVFTFAPGAVMPDGDPLVVEDLRPDDLAAIFYTSGTTGSPKGAMASQRNFTVASESTFRILEITRSEGPGIASLISLPLFHVMACSSQLVPVLELGGRVTLLSDPLDFDGFFRAVGGQLVNQIVGVPAIYYALIRHPRFAGLDVSSINWASYGGAPIAESLVREIEGAFPNARVGNGFGLTETSALASFLPHTEAAAHADSVGFAMPVVDLAIDEANPESGVGELLVRGPNVVEGYWKQPAATAETFIGGWLLTGDLARIDDDGLLYIVDRKKDMINRGGENIYSLEVESGLAGAPGVGEVAVIAVPDEMMGEKVGAVIVPTPAAQVDVDAVMAYGRARLADFKVPQYVALREDPLPRNPSGKVLKARLREETDWGTPRR